MKREITCVVCPRGCRMTAEPVGDGFRVTGHACPRGERHAIAECTNPVRTLTTTLAVEGREGCRVSVKTAAPIAKGRMAEAMALLRTASVSAPIKMGQVLLRDVCGADIVATKEVL